MGDDGRFVIFLVSMMRRGLWLIVVIGWLFAFGSCLILTIQAVKTAKGW